MSRSPSPERTEQILTLFEQVVGLDPGMRAAYLDQACADDPALRRELEDPEPVPTTPIINQWLDETLGLVIFE